MWQEYVPYLDRIRQSISIPTTWIVRTERASPRLTGIWAGSLCSKGGSVLKVLAWWVRLRGDGESIWLYETASVCDMLLPPYTWHATGPATYTDAPLTLLIYASVLRHLQPFLLLHCPPTCFLFFWLLVYFIFHVFFVSFHFVFLSFIFLFLFQRIRSSCRMYVGSIIAQHNGIAW